MIVFYEFISWSIPCSNKIATHLSFGIGVERYLEAKADSTHASSEDIGHF